MTFKEFKNTCYYTKDLLKIPLLNQSIEKKEFIIKNKYNFDKENEFLYKLYKENKLINK